tara:strand:+ start:317 stop:526 length:210 start_codon:yes stop_codon:yes gene_type:complete
MLRLINYILFIIGFLAIGFVISGYKKKIIVDDIEGFKLQGYLYKPLSKKEFCRPTINCRRVGFYCSKID